MCPVHDKPPLVETLSYSSPWPIGEVNDVRLAEGGASNLVYRYETPADVLFLKVYRKANAESVRREHSLMEHVRASGLPAVTPVLSRSGTTFIDDHGSIRALYPSARGEQVSVEELGEVRARAAGDMLGRVHRALQPLPDVGYGRWNLSWDGPEWVERLNRIEAAIVARSTLSSTDEWALRRLRAQRQWLQDPRCEHAYSPTFPCQVIHGDYQLRNLFFEVGEVSAVIDWEQAMFMPRGYELARACGFLRLEPPLTRAFLRGYGARVQLQPGELEDGVRAWGCFSDHHVWPLEEGYLHGNDAARGYIPPVPFRPFVAAWSDLQLSLPSQTEK